jgi:hypothetical protein
VLLSEAIPGAPFDILLGAPPYFGFVHATQVRARKNRRSRDASLFLRENGCEWVGP